MVLKKVVQHETYILIGSILVLATLSKLLGLFYVDSDWFWFLAGVALVLEGIMNLKKDKKFNKKFKIVPKGLEKN